MRGAIVLETSTKYKKVFSSQHSRTLSAVRAIEIGLQVMFDLKCWRRHHYIEAGLLPLRGLGHVDCSVSVDFITS